MHYMECSCSSWDKFPMEMHFFGFVLVIALCQTISFWAWATIKMEKIIHIKIRQSQYIYSNYITPKQKRYKTPPCLMKRHRTRSFIQSTAQFVLSDGIPPQNLYQVYYENLWPNHCSAWTVLSGMHIIYEKVYCEQKTKQNNVFQSTELDFFEIFMGVLIWINSAFFITKCIKFKMRRNVPDFTLSDLLLK